MVVLLDNYTVPILKMVREVQRAGGIAAIAQIVESGDRTGIARFLGDGTGGVDIIVRLRLYCPSP